METINISLTMKLQREIRQNRQLMWVYQKTRNKTDSPYHEFKKKMHEAMQSLLKINELIKNINLN